MSRQPRDGILNDEKDIMAFILLHVAVHHRTNSKVAWKSIAT